MNEKWSLIYRFRGRKERRTHRRVACRKKSFGLSLTCPAIVFLAVFSEGSYAQETFPVSELRFQGIFASRAGDRTTTYCLLGNGFILTVRSDEEDSLISGWLKKHPRAEAVPVSTMGEGSKMPLVYFWAVDGGENLNLLLIGKGAFPGSVMFDGVHFDKLMRGTKERTDVEAGYDFVRKMEPNAPAAKEMPPRRLIPDGRYETFLKELRAAEETARKGKLGIWSDKFKDLREEEEMCPSGKPA